MRVVLTVVFLSAASLTFVLAHSDFARKYVAISSVIAIIAYLGLRMVSLPRHIHVSEETQD